MCGLWFSFNAFRRLRTLGIQSYLQKVRLDPPNLHNSVSNHLSPFPLLLLPNLPVFLFLPNRGAAKKRRRETRRDTTRAGCELPGFGELLFHALLCDPTEAPLSHSGQKQIPWVGGFVV